MAVSCPESGINVIELLHHFRFEIIDAPLCFGDVIGDCGEAGIELF